MKQSKWISLIEVSLNVASGFLLAMAIWQFIVPVIYPHLHPSIHENFNVTLIFTVASICRGYVWRRLFNNGIHATVVNWAGRFRRKK